MDVFLNVFESILILLGIGIVGFIIISRKIVPKKILEVVSPLILDIALPCLIFTNIVSRFNPESFELWWTLPIWWIGFTAIMLLFTLIGSLLVMKKYRSEFAISLFYPNSIFIPMLVIQNLFGDNSNVLVELFLFALIAPAVMFNTYHLFFKRKNNEGAKFNWRKMFNPILVATIIAVAIKLTNTGDYVPGVFLTITKILGATALPLILILIGGNVYVDFQNKGKIQLKPVLLFVVIKNFLFPLLVLGIILIIKPIFSVAFLCILLSAVPPITAIPILTNKIGGNSSIANQFLIASIIVSVISIPLIMLLFEHFYPIV